MVSEETIAGCIRRIRRKLKGEGGGRVSADYGELMTEFNNIEAVHKREIDAHVEIHRKDCESLNRAACIIVELREFLKEAVSIACCSCPALKDGQCQASYNCGDIKKWRKVLDGGTK